MRTRDSASPPATGRRHDTEILVLVCAAQFMVVLDVSVVNVALPSIRESLGFSGAQLQWVVNAYTLTFGGLLLLGGRAGDLLGRKRMFIAGLAVFAIASLLGGLAQGEATMIAGRALQGLGGAIVAPATLALLTTTFREGPERTRAFAAWGAVAAAGGSVGVLLGGLLTDVLSWRWILFINIPIGVVIIWRAWRDLPADRADHRAAARSFDLPGALTVTLGLVAIVFAIVRTEAIGWGSAETLGMLALGLALLSAFVVIEARLARAPLMPLGIFRSRQLAGANLAVFLLGASMFIMWFLLSLYLQQVLELSPIEAGLAFLPQSLCLAVGSTQAAKVVARYGIRATVVTGFTVTAVGLALLTRIRPDGSYFVDVLVPSMVLAVGMGLCMVPLTTAAMAGVPRREAGLASGLVNVSRMVGGALGLAVLATAASSHTADLLAAVPGRPSVDVVHAALTAGFHRAFTGAALFAAAGAVVALTLLRTVHATQPAGTGAAAEQADSARAEAPTGVKPAIG